MASGKKGKYHQELRTAEGKRHVIFLKLRKSGWLSHNWSQNQYNLNFSLQFTTHFHIRKSPEFEVKSSHSSFKSWSIIESTKALY